MNNFEVRASIYRRVDTLQQMRNSTSDEIWTATRELIRFPVDFNEANFTQSHSCLSIILQEIRNE